MAVKKPLDFEKEVIPLISNYVSDLKFGSVTLVVQDGKIIQIEKNEKIRL